MTEPLKNIWTIQVFALLHAGVSLLCRYFGMADDMMLTLLTMMMVVILCLRRRTDIIYLTTAVILANIIGFLLGRGLALLFAMTALPALLLNPFSTFICTEIIGFSVDGLSRTSAGGIHDAKGLRWMLLAFVFIIIVRLVLSFVISDVDRTRNLESEILLDYIFSCIAILLLAEYALRLRTKAEKQAETANLAHFKYMTLKQQVNPHFLFNSLNVLDCMIQDGENASASEYTHRLAEVYRYMIHANDEELVRLNDELGFVRKYVDLQKVRFSDAIRLQIDVPEELYARSVVPCALQLLVENAIKHNAVSPGRPLVIDIGASGSTIEISNNVIPRLTKAASTGLGHKYLRQRYHDLARKSIEIRQEADRYTVILPLL